MSMYAIQDTTLTALGDAVRNKVNGTSELPMPISKENVQSNPYRLEVIEFPAFVKTVKVVGHVYDVDISNLNPQGILHNLAYASGVYTRDSDLRQASDFTAINPNWAGVGYDFEITVKSYALTFTTELGYNSWQKTFVYDYTAIGLDENGNEFKYTPLEMVDKINGLNMNPAILLPKIISRVSSPYYSVTKEDLGNITKIGNSAFYYATGLNSIELPDTVQSIEGNAFQNTSISGITLPAVLNELGNSVFGYCSKLTTVRILNDTSVITCPTVSYSNPFINCSLTSIYIPSKLYNAYCSDAYWGQHKDKFIAVGEWAFDPHINPALLFNQSVEVSIQLQDFANTPEFSITSSNEEVATISNISINEDNTLITYTINSLAVEGSSTITVNIVGENNTFNFINNVRVYETIPEPTYEVVAVENASYGFELNDNGYYESKNKGVSSSYAICQVNISNMAGRKVYFDCINSGESNYDFGILSKVNTALSLTSNEDNSSNYFKSFKGQSSTNVQTVEYTDAVDNCFIQVKFIKDSSGNQGNDTLQFKVRFEE